MVVVRDTTMETTNRLLLAILIVLFVFGGGFVVHLLTEWLRP